VGQDEYATGALMIIVEKRPFTLFGQPLIGRGGKRDRLAQAGGHLDGDPADIRARPA
jgi:hypothetical protein